MYRVSKPLLKINEKCFWAWKTWHHLLKLWRSFDQTHSGLSRRDILCCIIELSCKSFVIQLIEFFDKINIGAKLLPSVGPLYSRKLSHVHVLSIRWWKTSGGRLRRSGNIARGSSLHEERSGEYAFFLLSFMRWWLEKLLWSGFRWVVLLTLRGKA